MELPFYYTASTYAQFAGSLAIALSCLPLFKERLNHIKALGIYALSSILFSVGQDLSILFFNSAANNTIGNGFVLSEAILLGVFFHFVNVGKPFKKMVLISLLFYLTYYAITFLLFVENSFSYIRLGRDLLMIICAVSYFYYLLRKIPEENLLSFPPFWINVAVLFFFAGTFILSLFRDYIVFVLKDDMIGFWAFRNFFRFAFCLVLAYAGWLDLKNLRAKPQPVL